jgi:hypothetical protein
MEALFLPAERIEVHQFVSGGLEGAGQRELSSRPPALPTIKALPLTRRVRARLKEEEGEEEEEEEEGEEEDQRAYARWHGTTLRLL